MYHLMLFSVYPLCFLCLCSSLSAYFWINWTFFRIPFYMKFCLFRCSTLNLEIVIVPCSHKAPMVHYATVICITCIQYKPEKMLKFLTYKNYFNIKFKILTFLHILNELKEREKKCSLIRNWSFLTYFITSKISKFALVSFPCAWFLVWMCKVYCSLLHS